MMVPAPALVAILVILLPEISQYPARIFLLIPLCLLPIGMMLHGARTLVITKDAILFRTPLWKTRSVSRRDVVSSRLRWKGIELTLTSGDHVLVEVNNLPRSDSDRLIRMLRAKI